MSRRIPKPIEEDKPKMIERDKKYNIEMTGEEIALLALMLGKSTGIYGWRLMGEFDEMIGRHQCKDIIPVISLHNHSGKIKNWLDEVFAPVRTPEEAEYEKLMQQIS